MCKFCETEDDFVVMDDKEIDLGALGKMYASFKFWNEKHEPKKLSYDLYTINNDYIYEYGFEIYYCPFCGRLLRDEGDEAKFLLI